MQLRMVTAQARAAIGHVLQLARPSGPVLDFILHAGKQPESGQRLLLLHCRPCSYIHALWLWDAAADVAHVAPCAHMTAHGVSIESLSDDVLGRLFMLLPQGDRCHASLLDRSHGAQIGS